MNKQLSKGYWLGSNFKEIFEGVTPSKKAHKMSFTKLTKITTDEEIKSITGIMSKEDCLAALIAITKKKDPETMDGYANIIGYIEHAGSVWCVSAGWNSDDQKWDCDAYDLGDWNAGRRFWSRNETKTPSSPDTLSLGNLDARLDKLEKWAKQLNYE